MSIYMNISELDGETFRYIDEEEGHDLTVVVVIAEDDIGYTVADADDLSEEYMCCNGPLSPNYNDYEGADEEWEMSKALLRAAVASGEFNVHSNESYEVFGDSFGEMSCAFK